MKNYIKQILLIAFYFLSITTFSQDCWSPNIPTEKPCFIYFLGSGYGQDLETAKNNAAADGLRQVIRYLGITISYEAESKIEKYAKANTLIEETQFREVIKVINNPTIQRFAQIDICEKSFRKSKKVYILFRLPKGKDCASKPDDDEWKYQKIGISMLVPGVGQWKKREYTKAFLFPSLFLVGVGTSLYFDKSANDNYFKATLFGSSPIYGPMYKSYGSRDIKNRNLSILGTGIVYLVNLIDAKYVNTPKIYVYNTPIKLNPYYTNYHFGLSLTIALNK